MDRWILRRAARLAAPTLVLLAACGGEGGGDEQVERQAPAAPASALPEMVMIREPALHPEGIEWDAKRNRFLVGSLTHGRITAVTDDGSETLFVPAPAPVSSVGIHIDEGTDRLLVCYADPGVFSGRSEGVARLGIFDLGTGERIHLVDLGPLAEGPRFANDVTTDAEGNAYVTDSFRPLIYRVTLAGEASVLVRDERLVADPIGLNGIDWHPRGFLIAAVGGSGELFRIPLADPSQLEEVALARPFGADGIAFLPDGELAAVAYYPEDEQGGRHAEVLLLESRDGWRSASVAVRADMTRWQPTTVAVREGAVYAVSAHLAELFGGGGQAVEAFEIVRVRFPER